jgi:adenylate kinase
MYGSPGSGKGTQSELLEMVHISTGELLRASETGKKYLAENPGKLYQDTLIDQIVQERIEKLIAAPEVVWDHYSEGVGASWTDTSDFTLDGYPRTVPQADVLIEYLKSKNISVSLIFLDLQSQKEATERMLSRGRDDDTLEIIEKRFDVYRKQTVPVYDHLYKLIPSVLTVDASQPLTTVARVIRTFLGEYGR